MSDQKLLRDGVHDAMGSLVELQEDLERIAHLLHYLIDAGMLSKPLEAHKEWGYIDINALYDETEAFCHLAHDHVYRSSEDLKRICSELDKLWLKTKESPAIPELTA